MPRYDDISELEPDYDGAALRIGIVMSRFNSDVCEGLLSACVAELRKCSVRPDSIVLATVPGALEIPLALLKMTQVEKFDALIALGAVIRGETYHFELVANESGAGISSVQLDTGVPVANGVLTTENDEQAAARMSVKGAEAARAAIEMANLLRQLNARR